MKMAVLIVNYLFIVLMGLIMLVGLASAPEDGTAYVMGYLILVAIVLAPAILSVIYAHRQGGKR